MNRRFFDLTIEPPPDVLDGYRLATTPQRVDVLVRLDRIEEAIADVDALLCGLALRGNTPLT